MVEFLARCPCGAAVKHAAGGAIGPFMDETGWGIAVLYDGGIKRLCPPCTEKAVKLAEELIKVAGSEYVALGNLVNSNKRRKARADAQI